MKSGKTLDEWIAAYNRKAPEPFKRDERFSFFYRPDKGFAEIGQTDDMVIIRQLSGDGRFWKDKASEMARKVGLKMGGTWFVRQNIMAYIRLFGFRVVATEELPDGLKRYHCETKDGKKGLASPAFPLPNGNYAYFITWEV